MNPSKKPTVACYDFRDSSWILAVQRLWKGTDYLGLPADEIPVTESIEQHVSKVMSPRKPGASEIAIIMNLGRWSHLGSSDDYEWSEKPAVLSIFSFPEGRIAAPMSNRGIWISLDRVLGDLDPSFDVTLILFRSLLLKQRDLVKVA